MNKVIIFGGLMVCLYMSGCSLLGNNGSINSEMSSGSTSETYSISQSAEPSSASEGNPVQLKTDLLAALDLGNPDDCWTMLKIILQEIEDEKKLHRGEILQYSVGYAVSFFEKGVYDTVVYTVHDSPGSQLYIIVNSLTKDYSYFDAPITYQLVGADDEHVGFTCRDGQMPMAFTNFPFDATYSLVDNEWSKIHIPINQEYCHLKLGGVPNSYGILKDVVVTDSKAAITFEFKEFYKNNSVGSSLPITHYWYDFSSKIATLSFSGIELDSTSTIETLKQLPGIKDITIEMTDAIDLEAIKSEVSKATQVSFRVSDEYELFGEYSNTAWEQNNTDIQLFLWTKSKAL